MARVLVIEDEPLIAEAVQKGLLEESHLTEVAHDGADGLSLAYSTAFDLVILDLNLPRTPGLTVCRRLREAGATLPILMLTSRDTPADIVAGLDAGADDYVTKPFSLEVLLARVRTLLRRANGLKGPVYRVGPVELDTVAHRVWRSGQEVPLTAREFEILELLVRRQGSVLSKERIALAVWSGSFEGDLNAIEVHVASLRRKLDRGQRPQVIRTVRGVGYVVRADE